ncbi:MAG: dGTPase, partial [Flavobacteriaceae bacterium]|nr:dGTPase [Bacteroidia bacterium]NNL60319.1 dGTPase [Flavobacteriaceae bacterium]
DFEDGINLGLIQEEFALEYLINLVRDNIQTNKYQALTNTEDRISYLRALAIGTLINEAVEIFMNNEEAILNGKFDVPLLDKSKYEAQIDDIIKLSVEKVYQCKEVVEKEIAGYEVLHQLLHTYVNATFNDLNGKASNYDKLILKTLPETVDQVNETLYSRVMSVCSYISKLSDSNAILIHNKIKGIHF